MKRSGMTLVLPKREIVGDKDTVWESLLWGKGWNDLDPEDKKGRIVAVYQDGSVDVYFQALKYTARAIFLDELRLAA